MSGFEEIILMCRGSGVFTPGRVSELGAFTNIHATSIAISEATMPNTDCTTSLVNFLEVNGNYADSKM
jgi:hypothetical protein